MRPEKIGEKIKRIRNEKELSQSNLHKKQSAISQIENGVIKTPTASILRIIAGNMDISFEELIEGTTWEPVHQSRLDAEYAVSQTEVNVKIEDWGEIKTNRKQYDAYDKHGNARKYDPDTGYRLLTECKNCSYPIQMMEQVHCFGCGNRIFNKLEDFFLSYNEINVLTGKKVKWEVSEKGGVWSDAELMGAPTYTQTLITNPVESLEMVLIEEEKIRIQIRFYIDFKECFGNPNATMEEINSVTATWGDPSVKPNLTGIIFRDSNGKLFFPGGQPLSDSKQNKGLKKSSTIFDYADIGKFNPNDKKYERIEKLWVKNISLLSFYKGILKELNRHRLRLEAQQNISDEMKPIESESKTNEKE